MFENYWLISGIITLAWIALIGFYTVISSRHKALEKELQQLQTRLETHNELAERNIRKPNRGSGR